MLEHCQEQLLGESQLPCSIIVYRLLWYSIPSAKVGQRSDPG
jgi:hypothetical protein